uniref:Uncharacterized protein n=1 Tax=Tanacetum cinerariifolium TaxID=118510 RepID=A0A6L2LGB5_TANCI|nr:hypothetical protein [Tanacetum cinerariifolium]
MDKKTSDYQPRHRGGGAVRSDYYEVDTNESGSVSKEANEKNKSAWNEPKFFGMQKSFLNAVTNDAPKPKINFRTLINEERVEDLDFILPMETIIMAQAKFANTLVGYFIGKPIMLDAFTSKMCADQWRRLGFARALIKVIVEKELKQEVVMVVPKLEDTEKCPKRVPLPANATIDVMDDGFTIVNNCKKKGNPVPTKINEGVKMNKQKVKVVWQKVPQPVQKDDTNMVKLQNTFDALQDQDDLTEGFARETSGVNDAKPADPNPNLSGSDSEVEEMIMEPDSRAKKPKGAINENHLSVCAILESHVDISTLSKVCSKVFCSWDWSSNAGLCDKGCRIIIGWNLDTLFVTVIYVANLSVMRRKLWSQLGIHKQVDGLPLVLMGDFKVSLNMEDYYSGSYTMSSKMVEFKDVVANSWNISMDGYAMLKVVSKLKLLKKPLRKLVFNHGNLHERVNNLRYELDDVQKAFDVNLDDPIIREEEAVYLHAFNEAKLDKERFLKQKAKIEWLDVRDSNSAYFHKSVKARNQCMTCDNINIEWLFHNKVTDKANTNMVCPITDGEIKSDMFDIADDRAPGPNGKFLTSRIIEGVKDVRKRGARRCAFKVDIQKAYDTVDWHFLGNILKGFGFHDTMIKWIMACVTSASFSISLNGDYDLFLFARGDIDSAWVIVESLDEFKATSGLVPSIPKSTTFFGNVMNHVKMAILSIMPFAKGELPVKYLKGDFSYASRFYLLCTYTRRWSLPFQKSAGDMQYSCPNEYLKPSGATAKNGMFRELWNWIENEAENGKKDKTTRKTPFGKNLRRDSYLWLHRRLLKNYDVVGTYNYAVADDYSMELKY